MFKIEDTIGDVVFIAFKDVERIKDLGIESSGHYLVKGLDHIGIWLEHPGVILAKTVDIAWGKKEKNWKRLRDDTTVNCRQTYCVKVILKTRFTADSFMP